MTHRSILEYAASLRGRYLAADKKGKGVILGEFCRVTQYHRKAAVRLLNHPPQMRALCRRGRPPQYGQDLRDALKMIWEASGRVCSKRLAPFIPELIVVLERFEHLRPSSELRQQLLQVSPATIDRALRPYRLSRLRYVRHPHIRGPSSGALSQQVPVETFRSFRQAPVGFLQVDLVAHCGLSLEGFFLYTLVGVDVATGWTECRASWGKGHSRVGGTLDALRRQLPIPVSHVHSDNGSEFVNHSFYDYCQRYALRFSRGRPHKKNDQAFVEQKNGYVVRGYIGYGRYASHAAFEQLNRVYALLRLHTNFFQPTSKLIRYAHHGSRIVKHYDRAQTPYQRLLASQVLDTAARQQLQAIYLSLDPLQLSQQIEVELATLWKLEAIDPHSELAQRLSLPTD